MSRSHGELRDPVEAALAGAIGAAGLAGPLPVEDHQTKIRKRDVVVAGMVVFVSIVSFVIVTGGWLASYKPDWWNALPNGDDAPVASTAQAVEHGVTQAIDKMPSDGSAWRVELAESEANAWLASKLPKWIAHEGIDWPGDKVAAGVRFEPGRIVFGVEFQTDSGGRVLTAAGRPHIDEDGRVVIGDSQLGVGRLQLPASLAGPRIASWIEQKIPQRGIAEGIVDIFAHGEPVIRDPSVSADGSRRVRLVGIEVRERRIVITCQTTPTARIARNDPPRDT